MQVRGQDFHVVMSAREPPCSLPEVQIPSKAQKDLWRWLVAVAFFMEALDTTILNTAVPAISASLRVAPLSLKAVVASYTLSLAVFIPISGWMADQFGTRRIFAAAVGLFTCASGLCGLTDNIYALVACRVLQGCGGAMMVPVGRLILVRTFAKSELIGAMSFVAVAGLIGPMLGPLFGGLIVNYLHWRAIFFVNLPIGLAGLWMIYLYLPDYRAKRAPALDVVGFILFGAGIGLLSYLMEVFGEPSLSPRVAFGLLIVSSCLVCGYALNALHTKYPLLDLTLFKIHTFTTAVSGSFVTRIGIGGVPFLLSVLYQVGLGYTPVQSGLLVMPQALASISTKFLLPGILTQIGYRAVLLSNTVLTGLLILTFATIGPTTSVWLISLQAFCYGALSSLQYTSMNTLIYADIAQVQASRASTIASTLQQLSISFGVAAAGLITALFVPDSLRSGAPEMLRGVQKTFLVLGLLTIASTVTFRRLRATDGSSVSRHGGHAEP
jgi:EmrB/QacA subfamily drug resistance transporter